MLLVEYFRKKFSPTLEDILVEYFRMKFSYILEEILVEFFPILEEILVEYIRKTFSHILEKILVIFDIGNIYQSAYRLKSFQKRFASGNCPNCMCGMLEVLDGACKGNTYFRILLPGMTNSKF